MKFSDSNALAFSVVVCVALATFATACLHDVNLAACQSRDAIKMETHDDLLLRVERAAPGFGGMYVDRDGRLAVYLKDRAQLPSACAAIETIFGPATMPAAGAYAIEGQYTLSELIAWTRRAGRLLELSGVVLVDLDEARNRVAVGVDASARMHLVEKILASLDIPRAAVVVETTDPIKPLNEL
jgi:hypothetical protein